MSIDLNWETVTGGQDGQELADKIRDFIHTKFQSVALPRFIKSVTVHDFQFGKIPPEIELKDITDPLPDFYEDHVDSDLASDSDEEDVLDSAAQLLEERRRQAAASNILIGGPRSLGRFPSYLGFGGFGGTASSRNGDIGSPFMRVSTPGIPGGTSNLHYFHSHLATGLSGTQTPLAAVAGAQHLSTANWLEGHGHSASRLNARPNLLNRNLPPPTRDAAATLMGSAIIDEDDDADPPNTTGTAQKSSPPQQNDEDPEPRMRNRHIDDMQAVFRIRYAGDVKLLLTADILLDYPMPSFVGIPVRLSITGLTFDGVGVLAKIRQRVHFCFLSPEDAVAAVGDDGVSSPGEENQGGQQQWGGQAGSTKLGGLLQEIRVESEIGQRESGRQSLKNVGKVERFVLEQVRRIFEEEFVYPSFWTVLV
ncbi:Mitochondrial distribution and morphology protein 12 [Collariella sp. IMI 366227]|nr:Mitochondrial distribution and morphology protein 12 [Collariella sp. IMI 366227]